MKICIVSDLYYPYPGGVSEHVNHLAISLRKIGHSVKILTTNYNKNTIKSVIPEQKDSTDIIRLGIATRFRINKSVGIIPVGFNLQKAVKSFLFSSCKKGDFDILHLQTPNSFLSTIAIKYSKSVNVLTFHSSAPSAPWHKYAGSMLQPYIRKVDGAIAVSSVALETMLKFINIPNTRIIPNGIDIERFSACSQNCVLNKSFFNILFVGRNEPRKGLRYLLSAFPLIRREIPDAQLIVVGCKIDNHGVDGVHFKGILPKEDIPEYFAQSSVFCAPSTGSESFGIVLLEAMAAGTPVVASKIPGYQQVITDGEDGILIEPNNPNVIAAVIIELYKNKDLQKQLIMKGKKTAAKYSWDNVAQQVSAFYHSFT